MHACEVRKPHNLVICIPVVLIGWKRVRIVAVGDHHLGTAVFVVVSLTAILVSRTNRDGIDAVCVAISCT